MSVTIQMKATERYFPMALFIRPEAYHLGDMLLIGPIMLYKVVLTF